MKSGIRVLLLSTLLMMAFGAVFVQADTALATGYDDDGGRHDDVIEVEKKVKVDGGEWKDADKLHDAPKALPDAEISWLIQVKNESDKSVMLRIGDTMDGVEKDISAECPGPDGGELGADAKYECEFKSIAEAGPHVNIVTVVAEHEGKQEIKRDAAFYVGMQRDDDDDEEEGCGLGYWKTHILAWGETAYTPSDEYNEIFGVSAAFEADTLLWILWQGGGGEMALGRQAVAALLNASHPAVDYAYTEAEVIDAVQRAYAAGAFEAGKEYLEKANDGNCPLRRDHDRLQPGAGTPKFWKQHKDLWPLRSLFIGHKQFSQEQALAHMNQAGGDDSAVSAAAGDMTYEMFSAAVAGQLNVGAGNDATCIDQTLDAVDDWLAANPVGSGVGETDAAWQEATSLYATVTDYNLGQLCAPAVTDAITPEVFLPLIR